MCILIGARVLRVQRLDLDVRVVFHITRVGDHGSTVGICVPGFFLHVKRFGKQEPNEIRYFAGQMNHLSRNEEGHCH